MKALSFCKGICTYILITFLLFICVTAKAQLADSLSFNDFNDDMGAWTESQFAQVVPIAPGSEEGWLLLAREEGMSSATAPHEDPYISTGLVSLLDFCGVDLEFEITTFNLDADSHIYVDVSSDRGETFQIMRTDQELFSLTSSNHFENGQKSTVSFPIRSLLTDCLLYTSPSPRDGLLTRMPSSA